MSTIFSHVIHRDSMMPRRSCLGRSGLVPARVLIVFFALAFGIVYVYVPSYDRHHTRRELQREAVSVIAASSALEEDLQRLRRDLRSLNDGVMPTHLVPAGQAMSTERFLQVLGVEAVRNSVEISDVSDISQQHPARSEQHASFEVVARGQYVNLKTFSAALLNFGHAISLRGLIVSGEVTRTGSPTLQARLVFEIVSSL